MKLEPTQDYNKDSLKSQYSQMTGMREQFLDRAREVARYTEPTLIPPSGASSSTQYPTPYQSVGAAGLNNLAAKLLLSLLPPNEPFFRMDVDDYVMEELTGNPEARAEVENSLQTYERAIHSKIERTNVRSPANEAFKHLVVAGNVLMTLSKDNGLRLFPLYQYVCKRDPEGNVIRVIIEEHVSKETLPADIKMQLPDKGHEGTDARLGGGSYNKGPYTGNDVVGLYTIFQVCDNGKKIETWQEVEDIMVPKSYGKSDRDDHKFMALRWQRIDGEDYGRGYGEKFLGDLRSLEGLYMAMIKAAAVSARVLVRISGNASNPRLKKAISTTENGGFITAEENEVGLLSMDKSADLRVARELAGQIEQRLQQAFLMNSTVRRDAERVTATEIRMIAQELEDALGGAYSVLSQEFQVPLVKSFISTMEKSNDLPKLPKDLTTPTVVTGLEALGNAHKASKLTNFVRTIAEMLGPEFVMQKFNTDDLVMRMGSYERIDMDGLLKSQEQIQQEQAAQQQQLEQQQGVEMAKAAVPNAVKALADQANNPQQPQ